MIFGRYGDPMNPLLYIFFNLAIILLRLNNPLIITICMQFLAMVIIYPLVILYPRALECANPSFKGKIAALLTAFRLIFIAGGLQFIGYVYQGSFASIRYFMCGANNYNVYVLS